jgi:hypothetical protein
MPTTYFKNFKTAAAQAAITSGSMEGLTLNHGQLSVVGNANDRRLTFLADNGVLWPSNHAIVPNSHSELKKDHWILFDPISSGSNRGFMVIDRLHQHPIYTQSHTFIFASFTWSATNTAYIHAALGYIGDNASPNRSVQSGWGDLAGYSNNPHPILARFHVENDANGDIVLNLTMWNATGFNLQNQNSFESFIIGRPSFLTLEYTITTTSFSIASVKSVLSQAGDSGLSFSYDPTNNAFIPSALAALRVDLVTATSPLNGGTVSLPASQTGVSSLYVVSDTDASGGVAASAYSWKAKNPQGQWVDITGPNAPQGVVTGIPTGSTHLVRVATSGTDTANSNELPISLATASSATTTCYMPGVPVIVKASPPPNTAPTATTFSLNPDTTLGGTSTSVNDVRINHRFIEFTTGGNKGIVRPIQSGSNGTITVLAAFPIAPAIGDKAIIVGDNGKV